MRIAITGGTGFAGLVIWRGRSLLKAMKWC